MLMYCCRSIIHLEARKIELKSVFPEMGNKVLGHQMVPFSLDMQIPLPVVLCQCDRENIASYRFMFGFKTTTITLDDADLTVWGI